MSLDIDISEYDALSSIDNTVNSSFVLDKLVILESPYAANANHTVEEHVEYARQCVRDSLLRGEAPLASHLLYTQPGILNDLIPAERERGIDAGLAWLELADATVVYTDLGMSRGMQHGIDAATKAGIPVIYRRLHEYQ